MKLIKPNFFDGQSLASWDADTIGSLKIKNPGYDDSTASEEILTAHLGQMSQKEGIGEEKREREGGTPP